MRTNRVPAALLAVLGAFAAATVSASAGPPDCAACHKDDATDAAKFPLAAYRSGVHAKVECSLCHRRPEGSFDAVPHRRTEPDLEKCGACHGLNMREFKAEHRRGVHGDMPCNECHDAHTMPAERPRTETAARSLAVRTACLKCHEDEFPPGGGAAHSWLPSPGRHREIRCTACHAPLDAKYDHEIVPKARATRKCESCHEADSPLIAKYLGGDDRSGWVTNPLLFERAYVPGATRNRLADRIVVGVFAMTVVGALGHWLLRSAARARRTETPYEVHSIDLYPRGLRLWHWTNAALMVALAATGLRLHFGGRERALVTYEEAFNVHNLLGVLLVPVTMFFFVRAFATGDARQYLGRPQDGLRGLVRQVRYYLVGIFRGEDHPYHPSPERRFNPLQQVTYAGIMFTLVPVVVASGAILLFPDVLPERLAGKPGAWWVATAHYLGGAALVAFLLGHLYLATTGDRVRYLFSAMWTGRHRHHVPRRP